MSKMSSSSSISVMLVIGVVLLQLTQWSMATSCGKQAVECIDLSLITIPEDLEPSTQVLDMSGNNLQILPRDTFIRTGLLNLQKVFLCKCRLGQIDNEAFNGLTNLVELDLSQNLLTTVPSAILNFIPALRDLILAGNPIQKIDSNVFKPSQQSNKPESHCEIQNIAPDAFKGLTALHSLKLNGNKLSELRPRTIDSLSKLHNIELHDNPWICDCRLRAAKIWLTENNIPSPVQPICTSGPERVIDRSFNELMADDFACKPEMMPVNRFVESPSGENATIVCRVHAVPAAVINWYWNGRQLTNGSSFSSYQKVHIMETANDHKDINDAKLANPVQKPPRLTDITYSTSHYDGNGSIIISSGGLFASPTASAGNNPDLINDTKRFGSTEFNQLSALNAVNLQIPTTSQNCDTIERLASGEYSRAGGCDSLYPSGLWETNAANLTTAQQLQLQQQQQQHSLAAAAQDLYLKRTANSALNAFGGSISLYSEKAPIIDNIHATNFDDVSSSNEYLSRTFPRMAMAHNLVSNSEHIADQHQHQQQQQQQQQFHSVINNNNHNNNLNNMSIVTSGISAGIATSSNNSISGGYPSDYGLPIVPGAEHHRSREQLPPSGISNAKTLRVWQKGGVPVLPPVTALKRALTSSRNSPDEGYQEGCGTDV